MTNTYISLLHTQKGVLGCALQVIINKMAKFLNINAVLIAVHKDSLLIQQFMNGLINNYRSKSELTKIALILSGGVKIFPADWDQCDGSALFFGECLRSPGRFEVCTSNRHMIGL